MKKLSMKSLLSVTLVLLVGLVSFGMSPRPAFAEDAAVSDSQFVDGNWFAKAAAKGEEYKKGSPTNEALEAQLALYQTAVEEKNSQDAEKYAIRSWVKANYAAQIGLEAIEAGKFAEAKVALDRALKLAQAAQKPGAGKGEKEDRVCDDTAAEWQGCSAIEGKRAEKYVRKLMKKLPKSAQSTEGE